MELPVKIAIGSGVTFLFILCFGWIAFPALLRYGVKKQMTLEPGTELREMWSKLPFPVDFKIYVFNITNAKDVQNGDTPMLDEIGPYVYEEWKEKVNLVDNDTDDTVSFNTQSRWHFNAKESAPLTGDEVVTTLHPIIMTLLISTAQDRPPMINMVYKAVNGIFDNPSSIFITAPVKDILFDGIFINCNASDFIPHAACFEMKQEKSFKRVGEHGLLFSFFGHKNESYDAQMKVKRGTKDYLELNKLVEFMNRTEMRMWPTKECNKLQGTEGSVFHALHDTQETLYGFASLMCRTLPLTYVEDIDFHGIATTVYSTTYGDNSNEKEKCYCPNKNYCLKKGAMDLTRCMKAPVVVTYPHFYDTDKSYQESVRGLRPCEDQHKSVFYFEPFTGIILSAKNRIQFNFQLRKIENVTIMKNVPESLVPVMWLEEMVELNSTYLNNVDKQVFLVQRINKVLRLLILIVSLLVFLFSIYMFMHKKKGFSLGSTFPTIARDISEPKKNNIISSLSSIIEREPNNT